MNDREAFGEGDPMPAIAFVDVDIFFGPRPEEAARLARAGRSCESILKATGTTLGVAGCSLDVDAGGICVLMGLSGSGKSTLLRAVNGLNRVSGGAVWVKDGGGAIDVAACGETVLRRLRRGRIAMVFQQFGLLPWASVAENVGLGLELCGKGKAERDRVVAEKLDLVGLGSWADKRIDELSGGMQQRVGLARAFATDADILLMDEPFSALDPLIRKRLQDELVALQRQLKKTILFVSHDLDEAIRLGDRIAIMEGGRIIQVGTPEDVVLNPLTDYVAAFVAHMNPMGVLRAGTLMTPIERLARHGQDMWLDGDGRHSLFLDAEGEPLGARREGRTLPIVAAPEAAATTGACYVWIEPDLPLEEVIRLRRSSGLPILIARDKRLLGVVGDDEIYAGLLRQQTASGA